MIEQVKINKLNFAKYNPRTISDEELQKLSNGIKEFGFVQNIVVNKHNNVVIGGHQRIKAAQKCGYDTVPVFWVNLNESKEKTLNLALNKISGNWDNNLLKQVLNSIDESDLALSGFNDDEIESMLAELSVDEFTPLCDEDEVPDKEERPITKLGDIWHLGKHTLMCGDSTSQQDIDRLLQGVKTDMCFTDPPYLMNFEGGLGGDGKVNKHAQQHKQIINDNLNKKDGDAFLNKFVSVVKNNNKGAFYITFYRLGIERILNTLTANSLKWRNIIIWFKGHLNLSNSDYKAMYEPIIYGFSDDYTPIVYGWGDEHNFYGAKNNIDAWDDIELPSFWKIDRTKKNTLHPTMKPVALCERAILNSSKIGDSVLDLFGGSGSTLIACEKTGRICYMNELEPLYVDVIIRRWQKYTGLEAVNRHNETFNQLECKHEKHQPSA